MHKVRFARRAVTAAAAALLAGSATSFSAASAAPAADAGGTQTYVVVYHQPSVPPDAGAKLAQAGGRLVARYDQIGVAIATSNSSSFVSDVRKDTRVQGAGASVRGVVRLKDRIPDRGEGPTASGLARPALTDSDSLSSLQWDMRQIHAPEAHAITTGSKAVLVGDIDTGMDGNHPDLQPNVDVDNSVSCIGGSPDTSSAAWNDDNGHGTHTAGTIAAADNGIGIVGVAPNVRIAAIKAGDANGFFFPEAVVCAFVWAGTHHMDVTNNSYFGDPFYYNCPSHPEELAILTAEARAIQFAQSNGVLVVAAADNFSDDLAHPSYDRQSPTNGTPSQRPVTRACLVIPLELPGVVGVGATGSLGLKAFYSNYGRPMIDVVAPGGDSRLQVTADAPNGRVLSTWPAVLNPASDCPAARKIIIPTSSAVEPQAAYCYAQGTSMATPHVVGVAALALSRFPFLRGDGELSMLILQALVDHATDPIACPSADVLALYAPFLSLNNDAPQVCTGDATDNAWYGHGQVNALKAVGGEPDRYPD